MLYKNDVNPCDIPIKLKDGDVIRFDSHDKIKSHENAVTIIFSTTYDKRSKWRTARFNAPVLDIGLSSKRIIEFESGNLSVKNVVARRAKFGCTVNRISRLCSIKYNNHPVTDSCYVKNKDVLCIDNNYLFYDNGVFLYNICLVTEPGLSINLAETYVSDKLKKKVLLKDVNVNIDKGDFALIIGGSGAGKSTFMNSILGKYDINGTISIGGFPASDGNSLTSDIAYVPQTLPIRKEERLIDVVTDTCILRCKTKMSKEQRKKFVLDTLDSLGLKRFIQKLLF